jgi:hypothetical protein
MAESLALALAVEAGLKVMAFTRLRQWLDSLEPSRLAAPCAAERLERFSSAAWRWLPVRSTCLRRSLVLYALLRRRGAMPTLWLGVRKDRAGFAAHAWISCAGLPPDERAPQFQPLAPASPASLDC